MIESLSDLLIDLDLPGATAVRASRPAADLPDPKPISMEALTRRYSERFFSAEPIAPDQLVALADKARSSLIRARGATRDAGDISILVCATRVTGVPVGIYAITPTSMEFVTGFDDGVAIADLVLQPEFAHAPAIFLVLGTIRDVGDIDDYRNVLTGGAHVAGVLAAAAAQTHLVGSIFAGFLPSALRILRIADQISVIQVLSYAVGYPASTDGTDTSVTPHSMPNEERR